LAFSIGSLGSAYSDGGSTSIGTSETTINALSTSFLPDSEVVVIASEQFASQVGIGREIPSTLNKLRNDQTGDQAVNQYAMPFPGQNVRDDGKGFGLLNRFTSAPANPQYHVKATASDTGLDGESKILALAMPIPLYRSVGRGALGNGEDLNTDSHTVQISGTTAIFSGPMADRIGVGDVLAYNSGGAQIAFIHGRASSKVYSVKDKNGNTPAAAPSGTAVGVYRAYISLSNWNYQFENTEIPEPVENDVNPSKDLVSANRVMMVACYDDGWSADYGADISGWTTDTYRYIKIYTPVSSSEVGVSQRHYGKWDNTKYRILDDSAGINIIGSITRDIWIDGLQIYLDDVTGNGNSGILINQTGTVNHRISNNIVRGADTYSGDFVYVGIYGYDATSGSKAWVWNNIVYGFNGTNAFGIYKWEGNLTLYAYNNTVYNCRTGFITTEAKFTAKNNISMCDVVDSAFVDFSGTFSTASTHNYSSDITAPDNGGANPSYENKTLAEVDFFSTISGSEDFHLQPTSDATGVGTDLSSDSNLAFSYDIDDHYRYGSWDIGADEYVQGAFEYRRQITVNCSGRGTSCTGGLSDFPVLIDTSNWPIADKNLLRTVANGGHVYRSEGYDIIFRASDGRTHLDHEVEKYDGLTGTLVAWVRIPTLFDQCPATDTNIYIYYGNAGITDFTENPTGVWNDGGNNYFKGVWHLKETVGGFGAIKDSTSYVNHGTDSGGPTIGATGKIDGGIEFDGSNDVIRIDNSNAAGHELDFTAGPFTISAWFNTQSNNTHIAGKRDGSLDQYQFGVGIFPTLFFRADNKEGWGDTAGYSYNTWYYAAVVVNASGWPELYLNGTQQPWDGDIRPFTFTHRDVDFSIGARWATDPATAAHFDGFIDEVRVSSTDRSSCWIETEYNNQSNPGTFLTRGSEEGPGVPTAIGLISFTVTGFGNDIKVDWHTGHEVANLGFNIYRSKSPTGPFKKINSALIPGLNYSVEGKAYSYLDTDVSPGSLYYYKLEDIDAYGTHTFHGPVCVDWDADGIPDDWEIRYGLNPWVNDADIDSDGDGGL
jgi:hypothetical protein